MLKRPTKAEREAKRSAIRQRAFDQFLPKLERLQSMRDAFKLLSEAPPPDAPGREFYSNLGFFLQSNFGVPNGSTYSERILYTEFVKRLAAAGTITQESSNEIQGRLKQSMDD
jgi:hypothetical protein